MNPKSISFAEEPGLREEVGRQELNAGVELFGKDVKHRDAETSLHGSAIVKSHICDTSSEGSFAEAGRGGTE